MSNGLDAHVVVPRKDFTVDVGLTVSAGDSVAVLGPNGAGKTTLLRALAGLVPMTGGHVRIGGVDVGGMPAEQRPIGLMFQDHRLFPHLTVVENVAFGLRAGRVDRTSARRRAMGWLDRVGVGALADVRPGRLSGGQAQRVALARTLACEPNVLLLDEPLAALDAATRGTIRRDLRGQLAEFEGVRVVVTHDPVDALTLGDRLIVIEEGCVVQEGSGVEIVAKPRTDYVAELVGTNLYRGKGSGTELALAGGHRLVVADEVNGDLLARVEPRAVALHRTRPDGSPRNVWSGPIVGVDSHRDHVRVRVGGPIEIVAEITAGAVAALDLHEGGDVWVAVKATEITTYEA